MATWKGEGGVFKNGNLERRGRGILEWQPRKVRGVILEWEPQKGGGGILEWG